MSCQSADDNLVVRPRARTHRALPSAVRPAPGRTPVPACRAGLPVPRRSARSPRTTLSSRGRHPLPYLCHRERGSSPYCERLSIRRQTAGARMPFPAHLSLVFAVVVGSPLRCLVHRTGVAPRNGVPYFSRSRPQSDSGEQGGGGLRARQERVRGDRSEEPGVRSIGLCEQFRDARIEISHEVAVLAARRGYAVTPR